MKSPQSGEHRPIAEMIRGVQTVMSSLRSAILLISTPPEEWRAEKASSLGGVIVVPSEVTAKDLDILRDRNLPYLLFTESDLAGPTVFLGQSKAAKQLTERLLALGHRRFVLISGYDAGLDASKRQGIHDAFRAAGIDPDQVPEIIAKGGEGGFMLAARHAMESSPRPTAAIAFDDSIASILSFHARRIMGLRVPEDLSIASFHDWPYLNFVEPVLSTVHFDFFAAGQKAAENLSTAALTGGPVTDITFEPCHREGQTVGPAPV